MSLPVATYSVQIAVPASRKIFISCSPSGTKAPPMRSSRAVSAAFNPAKASDHLRRLILIFCIIREILLFIPDGKACIPFRIVRKTRPFTASGATTDIPSGSFKRLLHSPEIIRLPFFTTDEYTSGPLANPARHFGRYFYCTL